MICKCHEHKMVWHSPTNIQTNIADTVGIKNCGFTCACASATCAKHISRAWPDYRHGSMRLFFFERQGYIYIYSHEVLMAMDP